MSVSPFVHTEVRPDRASDAPLAVDMRGGIAGLHDTGSLVTGDIPVGWASRLPPGLLGMSGYLVAGVGLGLVLIVALSLMRGESLPPAAANAVTDNIVHLHAKDVSESCWRGVTKAGAQRVTVSMEIGLDGKVRSAVAAGDAPTMKSCVEAHVKGWEFLPQAQATTMVLPFEIDTR